MSGALANASRLKPEIRLAQAVSQFEADLSSEQKATFRLLLIALKKGLPSIRANVEELILLDSVFIDVMKTWK
jgi:hypothetical protein